MPDMRKIVFLAPLLLLLACGGKSEAPGGASAGHGESGGASSDAGSTSASGSTSAATGGVNETGGASAGGGKPTGVAGDSAHGGSVPAGGAPATAGEGGQGTAGTALVDCDLRTIICKSAQPVCPDNQVPSVNGVCFGPCVPIESCACSVAADCPFNDRYTCWQQTHCGPYVK